MLGNKDINLELVSQLSAAYQRIRSVSKDTYGESEANTTCKSLLDKINAELDKLDIKGL